MPAQHRRLSDPRELQALAHPVRMGIIEQLTLSGPLTATQLADRLDETPANCSWHLRKLAKFGFVEEAEGGTGRQRPWQVPSIGFTWEDEPGQTTVEQRHAARAMTEVVMARSLDRLREAEDRLVDEPQEWRDTQGSSQAMMWLTAAELQELNDAIQGIVYQYFDRITDASKRPEGARLCELVAWCVPTYFPGVEQA